MYRKTVYFSPPEEEMIESLQEIYGITRLEACNQIIIQKRDLAYQYKMRGNIELSKNIMLELGEWNDEHEEEFKKLQKPKNVKIILP